MMRWNPRRSAIGFASLVLLVGSGFLLRDQRFHRPAAEDATRRFCSSTFDGLRKWKFVKAETV